MYEKEENNIVSANIDTIFNSSLFRIFDFKCREQPGSISKTERVNSFNISFTRKGNFQYKTGKRTYDIYNGVVLLENRDTEYIIAHDYHTHDECTSISIRESLLKEIASTYSKNEYYEFPSVVIPTTPELEYIHMYLYNSATHNLPGKLLQTDLLVIHLLQLIFSRLTDKKQVNLPIGLSKKRKDQHLETIDLAKSFILENCHKEISLADIAFNSYVSVFHFSRLFKHFTSYSPYQYLIEVRLNRAVLLLRNTSLSITEICFESGFNSLEHFISTFSNRFKMSPLKFRGHKS